MKWLKSGILLVALLATVRAAPAPIANDDEDSLRLPRNSAPIHYDIALTTNVHTSARAFTGNVRIEIEILETSFSITLHNRGLQIDEVKLTSFGGADVEIVTRLDAEKEFLIIESQSAALQYDEHYFIDISYRGQLQLGTTGFYRSSYRVDGGTRYYITDNCYRELFLLKIFDKDTWLLLNSNQPMHVTHSLVTTNLNSKLVSH